MTHAELSKFVLLGVAACGPATAETIASLLDLRAKDIEGILRSMEKRGLIERTSSGGYPLVYRCLMTGGAAQIIEAVKDLP